MLTASYPRALVPFHVPNNITCMCVSPHSFHMEILLYQHGQSAPDTSRISFLLASTLAASCRLAMNHPIHVYVLSPSPARDVFVTFHHVHGHSVILFLLYQHGQSALDTSMIVFILAPTLGISCRLVMDHLIHVCSLPLPILSLAWYSIRVYAEAYVYFCVCIGMCVYLNMYICMRVCMCTCLCIYRYLFSCPSVPAPQLLILHCEY